MCCSASKIGRAWQIARVEALGASLLLLAAACGGTDQTALDASQPEHPADGAALELMAFEEYRDRAATEMNGRTVYRVEWDLYFHTEEALLDHFLARSELLLQRSGGPQDKAVAMTDSNLDIVSFERGPEALDISYCIDSSTISNVALAESEMAEATAAWERVANVRFRYDAGQNGNCSDAAEAGLDFVVFDNATNNAFACPPFLPQPNSWGCTTGFVNVDYTSWPYQYNGAPITNRMPNMTRLGFLRHELGHLLGLHHEHPYDDNGSNPSTPADAAACTELALPCSGCSNTLLAQPLTEYDLESVMHYPQCQGDLDTSYDVSDLDGLGVRQVYGMPVAWTPSLLML